MRAIGKVEVRPITDADVPGVARFLHTHLNQRVPAAGWARAMQVPWKVDAPNHGFLLRTGGTRDGGTGDGGTVVGAYLAFYSERVVGGRPERFCNLGAWCVLPEQRFHGPRLLRALLAQEGFHFTDLSPSGSVVAINARLGFQPLDTTTVLVPNLPWPALPGRVRVSSDPAVVEATLTGADRDLYHDHVNAPAARHAVLVRGGRSCYVIFRRDRRKGLPVFASLLHVSDPELFCDLGRAFGRHLLLRHRVPLLLVEQPVVPYRPWWSRRLASGRPKMFRSDRLGPDQIDYLYSELTCVAW